MASYNYELLRLEDRNRYTDKLNACGISTCPYQIPADYWINDPMQWPQLEWPEVFDYLLNTPGVYTRESMKNRKSLEAHNQFTSGWVRTVFLYQEKGALVSILKAEVTPSQRLNEDTHTAWAALSRKDESVVAAHCSCMAGLGESCSHIGALLFKIEAAVRAGFTKRACTEEACKWNNDFMQKIEPSTVAEINFFSEKTIEKRRRKHPNAVPQHHSNGPSDEKKKDLLTKLSKANKMPVVLHSFTPFADAFIPKFKPAERVKAPASLRRLYSASNCILTQQELSILAEREIANMGLSQREIDYVYERTLKQSGSMLWYETRVGRITASTAHCVLHTDMNKPSKSLIKKICGPAIYRKAIQAASISWGKANEKVALNELKDTMSLIHTDFQITECGLKLCAESFIGASSDGIFSCRCHELSTLIEVKCPYSMRETNKIEDAIICKNFCIDSRKELKKNHQYYTQIQIQLYVYKYNSCIFVVWTPKWIFHTIVFKDDSFISSAVPKLERFFRTHAIKELLTRSIENEAESSLDTPQPPKLYCYCQKPEDTSRTWVGCDAMSCKYEWFHLECLNLHGVPRGKGKWYCPTCKEEKKQK